MLPPYLSWVKGISFPQASSTEKAVDTDSQQVEAIVALLTHAWAALEDIGQRNVETYDDMMRSCSWHSMKRSFHTWSY